MISKKKQLRQRKQHNKVLRTVIGYVNLCEPKPVVSFSMRLRQETMEKRLYKELGLSQMKSDIIDTRNSKGLSGRNPDLNWSSSKVGNVHLIPQLYKDLEPGISGQPVREVTTPLYNARAHGALTKACRERTGYADDELTPNRVVNPPALYSHEAHRRYMEGEAAKTVAAEATALLTYVKPENQSLIKTILATDKKEETK